jgi:beta-xylosidase
MKTILLSILVIWSLGLAAQQNGAKRNAFEAPEYTNPIIYADYSDPDVIAVGNDFYLVASSFNAVPGLPILHSKDLIHWELIGYALHTLQPYDHYSEVQHGGGVWAPSIRYYRNEFYIYYPDPDFGIYMIKAKSIRGPWSTPVMVKEGKGLIDPCPFWDEDGRAYMVHAFAGSRAGIKSILVVNELNREGTKVISDAALVYDGHDSDPTVEGPKFYKHNGYYYIFAPAGGVSTGWQIALRSRNIFGPYERKVVLNQGKTDINGPHQGAWVTTSMGENWFLHFQDKEAYGRVVLLEPMRWIDDWPYIGYDFDENGIGEPLAFYRPPRLPSYDSLRLPTSDEFNSSHFGLQWQWQANPQSGWAFMSPGAGMLRLNSFLMPDTINNFWSLPSLLLQKFPAENFIATTRIRFTGLHASEEAGLVVFGSDYARIGFHKTDKGLFIERIICNDADKGNPEETTGSIDAGKVQTIFLRVTVRTGAICSFSYSTDGVEYHAMGQDYNAKQGRWVGAKLGLYCVRREKTNDAGYADVDWFRIEILPDELFGQ